MARCVAKARASETDSAAAEEDESSDVDEDGCADTDKEETDLVVLTEDDDAAGEGSTVALAAVTGDIKQRLVEFQKQFLAPLMRNF